MYCYFRFMFFSRNCSFKSLLHIFWKYEIIINRQSYNWNIKFMLVIVKLKIVIWSFLLSIRNFLSILVQVLFHSLLKANQETSKNYSNILMEQQILCLKMVFVDDLVVVVDFHAYPDVVDLVLKVFVLFFLLFLFYTQMIVMTAWRL